MVTRKCPAKFLIFQNFVKEPLDSIQMIALPFSNMDQVDLGQQNLFLGLCFFTCEHTHPSENSQL